jgi:hypothetical protein
MPIGLDVSLPLQISDTESFYVLNQTIKENMQQKVKMLLLTAPGERIMVPNYGVGLKNFLFENNGSTTEIDIIESIEEQIRLFLSDIAIVSLEVKKSGADSLMHARTGQKNTLAVSLVYLIKGTDIKDAVTLMENNVV